MGNGHFKIQLNICSSNPVLIIFPNGFEWFTMLTMLSNAMVESVHGDLQIIIESKPN